MARGVASLVMIQGHAYHAWVSPALHGGLPYRATRVLGTVPLPAFLVLAGAAVMLRLQLAAARASGDPQADRAVAAALRRRLVWRGVQVMGWGYATSALYYLMDGGEGLRTLLRADVLQVIGLSIAVVAAVGLSPGASAKPGERLALLVDRLAGPLDPGRFARRTALLCVLCTLASPVLNRLGPAVDGPLRYVVATLVDVPGVTRMPLFPLIAWFGTGVVAAHIMGRARSAVLAAGRPGHAARAGAPDATALGLAATGLLLAVAGAWATPQLTAALGGTLSRTHPAVWLNVADLAGRGLLLLGTCVWLSTRLPARVSEPLSRLGRGSLVAYVFHIPLCYGRPGQALQGQLQMPEATLLVLLLMVASYAAVRLRDGLWRRPGRAALSGADPVPAVLSSSPRT